MDDEQIGRSALNSLLIGQGYRLHFAEDGPTAIQIASETLPDLILLDVMMPNMDGYEVTQRLRSFPALRDIPILLVTALDDTGSRLKGIEAGADDFVSKPFDRVEMRARIRTITRLNRFRRLTLERANYQRLFETAPCGLLVLDETGRIRQSNAVGSQLLKDWMGGQLQDLRIAESLEYQPLRISSRIFVSSVAS